MPNIRDMFSKRCYRCGEVKSFADFGRSAWIEDGVRGDCKDCASLHSRTKRLNNPNQKADDRRYNIRRKYQISIEDYDQLFASQSGLCAICLNPETALWKGEIKPLAVDHCHETGENRGLLCSKCNVGLGYFRESAELLKAAITYLQTYQTT